MGTKTKAIQNTTLIIFQKTGAVSISYPFDITASLTQVRSVLTSSQAGNFMAPNDFFLNNGSKVLIATEDGLTLDALIDEQDTVHIGIPQVQDPLDPQDGVQSYDDLSAVEKNAIFENNQVFHGLSFTPNEGFQKSFKQLYTWKNNQFPDAVTPRVSTQVVYTDSFSKVTNSLQETSTHSGSVSLNTPYGGGEAEFKYEQSKQTTSTEITAYITGKYLVRKVALQMDLEYFEPTQDFDNALNTVLQMHANNDFKACKAVVEVLNTYGYYIPKKFNLGGVLFSSDTTTISEYSETETNIQEFGGSFKAAFNGIGGGASYSNAQGSTQTTTTSDKFQITSFSQIGGRTGTSNDYNEWAKSLDNAIYWGVATLDELLPSIAIMSNIANMNRIILLFDKFNSYPGIHEIQPHINLLEYATATQNIFNPWGV